MKENDIVLYENQAKNVVENENYALKRKQKRRVKFKRFLILLLIIGIFTLAHKHKSELMMLYNQLVNYFNADTDTTSDTDSSYSTQDTNSDTSTNSSNIKNDGLIEDKYPFGAHMIIESNYSFCEINNTANVDLSIADDNINLPSIDEIYKKYGNEAPVVLIIHSSALESYSNGEYYTTNDDFYSSKSNVAEIGKAIHRILNDNNINAIHLDDIYANGSIYSSTEEYERALDEALVKYPSIAYVFDISRDVKINDDFTMNKAILELNDTKMAQIRLLVGTSSLKEKTFWHKNLYFANRLATTNSDLIYDLTLSGFELSQSISPISIKIDIGSYANSINEAMLAGNELALRLCSFLKQG